MKRAFIGGLTAALLTMPALAQDDTAVTPAVALRAMPGPVPARVVKVVDGDTFRATVSVWLDHTVSTAVRLRGVDTPEMKGRCPEELAAARRAQERLAELLHDGATLTQITRDKYAGRVDATVTTASGHDVAEVLISEGHARRYAGGKRQGWCPPPGQDGQ